MARSHLPIEYNKRLFKYILGILMAAALHLYMAHYPRHQLRVVEKVLQSLSALGICTGQGCEQVGIVLKRVFFHPQRVLAKVAFFCIPQKNQSRTLSRNTNGNTFSTHYSHYICRNIFLMKNALYLFVFLAPVWLQGQTPDIALKQMDSLILLSREHTGKNEFDKALEINDAAEKIALQHGGPMSAAYGSTCFNRGRVLHFRGDYRAAEPWYLCSKDIRAAILGQHHEDYGKSLNNLAIVYDLMSRYEESVPLYQQVLDLRKKLFGETSKPYADALSNLATSYMEIGEYEMAEDYTLEAMHIREKILGKNSMDYSSSLTNLANLYAVTDNYEKAAALYREGTDILTATGNQQSLQYAFGLSNLGATYQYLKRYNEAESLHLASKALREKLLGTSNPQVVESLKKLGDLYDIMNQNDKAIAQYSTALTLGKKVLGAEHLNNITTEQNLGMLYFDTKRYKKAAEFLQASRAGYEKKVGKSHPYYCINNAISLIQLYRAMDNTAAAKSCLLESAEPRKNLLLRAAQHLSERELFAYTQRFAEGFNLSFSLAMLQPDLAATCYDEVLFYKGFLLHTGLQIRKLATTDSTATALYYRLKACKRRLAAEYAKPVAERNAVEVVENEANDLEKTIARTATGYREATQQVGWQAVQAQLRDGEAALEFVDYQPLQQDGTIHPDRRQYAALLLLPGKAQPQMVALFEEKQLLALLRTSGARRSEYVHALYAAEDRDKKTTSKTLYDLLWRPLAPVLKGVKTIYFSPSGLLHRINLAAIRTPSGQVLADQYQLVQLGSTRQLAVAAARKNAYAAVNGAALLFGGIQYEPDSTALAAASVGTGKNTGLATRGWPTPGDSILRGGGWGYLQGTAREIDSIKPILTGAGLQPVVRQGVGATEEAFKSMEMLNAGQTPSPRVVHVATHGFFFSDAKGNPTGSNGNAFKTSNYPMMRSGLLLAGANHAWTTGNPLRPGMEDGVLTAYEISQMNFSNTELVVLSACETGLGDLSGNEGVYGLQRAFKIAGARYLIMSLWQVPDSQTQELMTTFYQKWLAEKMSIPDAFRAAQKAIREKYEHPFFWAGFVLVE